MAAAEDFTFIPADLRDPDDLNAFRVLNEA